MWTLVLVVLIVFLFGSWGYQGWRGGGYLTPTGGMGLLLLILFIILLVRGAL